MSARFVALAVVPIALLLTQCSAAPPQDVDGAPAFASGEDFRLREALQALESGDAETAWFRFWELAIEGDPAAQVNLAQLYRIGTGIPAEPRVARRWIEMAATSGHPLGQYRLGELYETNANRTGSRVDRQAAALWYERAAEQGFDPARAALARLRQPIDLSSRN
jgi:TPR repeat protein